MKNVVISGASSGIGKEIAKALLSCGYKVLGIGRNFKQCSIKNENFIPIVCDLSDKKELHRFIETYKKRMSTYLSIVPGLEDLLRMKN